MSRRVFKDAAEAEAAGFRVLMFNPNPPPPTYAHRLDKTREGVEYEAERAIILTPLEALLADALEALLYEVRELPPSYRPLHVVAAGAAAALKAARSEDGS